jgi:hypothetical protein
VNVDLGMLSAHASANYPALETSSAMGGNGSTCLTLGIQQLNSSTSTSMGDRIVFSFLVVAQSIEAVRW